MYFTCCGGTETKSRFGRRRSLTLILILCYDNVMIFPLITSRLFLRPPSVDDFEALFAIIWSDPAVMRFVAAGQTRTRERTSGS